MAEKEESIEEIAKKNKTLGVGINGAPAWIVLKIKEEAEKYYANIYWPVIIDWYRKAKQMELVMSGGIPPLDENEEKDQEEGIPLFGGHKGR